MVSLTLTCVFLGSMPGMAPIPKQSTWDQFRKICGDTKSAKSLFDEMTKDKKRAEMLDAAMGSELTAFDAYSKRCKELNDKWTEANKAFQGMVFSNELSSRMRAKSMEVVSKPDVLTVLFLGSKPIPKDSPDRDEVTCILLASFMELASGDQREATGKLFATWLENRTGTKVIQFGFESALFANLNSVVPLARNRLADPKSNVMELRWAITCLGNHGTKDDLPLLLKFKADERKTGESISNNGPRFEHQLRDVVAPMALKLAGEDLVKLDIETDQYIVWWVGNDPAPFDAPHSFDNAKQREDTLKKAWDAFDRKAKELKLKLP